MFFIGGFDLWVIWGWVVLILLCGFCFGGLELFVLCLRLGRFGGWVGWFVLVFVLFVLLFVCWCNFVVQILHVT